MNFIKRMPALVVSMGAALALTVTAPFAASATVAPAVDTDGFIKIEPGSTPAEIDAQIHAALRELEGKQSPEEIEALSKLPGTIFWVPEDNGVYASAVNLGSPRVAIAVYAVIGGHSVAVGG